MKTKTTTLSDHFLIDDENLLLLDIETTGLTPDLSGIFMIGCAYFCDHHLEMIQWLSDSPLLESEQAILQAFSDWLSDFTSETATPKLLTYNGQTFDLPFIRERFHQCRLSLPEGWNDLTQNHQDIYRQIKSCKNFWPLSNLKLKTVASWLGMPSVKTPEGRHLIKAYQEYLQSGDMDIQARLFLHNEKDLEALARILPVIRYFSFFAGAFSIERTSLINNDLFQIELGSKVTLPKPVNYTAYDFSLNIQTEKVILQIPVCQGRLRYYHMDIKNYVYLPAEDCAIPKSMATFVDRSHWIKISRETCYTWFALDNTFMTDPSALKKYALMIFQLFGFTG